MSHRKDTDYLAISARIRAMENRLLTRERMDRMIEAKDGSEAMKILTECGYPEGGNMDEILARARAEVFHDMKGAAPDPKIVQLFQLKYDYHNAKTILKATAMETAPERLLLPGGRYDPEQLLEGWRREELHGCSETFRAAMEKGRDILNECHDPQLADLALDRACYLEMAQLAKEVDSKFLEGYVKLSVDVANLRTAVRVYRMGRDAESLRQVLLPGGNVSEQSILGSRGDGLDEVFHFGALAQAAQLGTKAARTGEGSLTAFERACDNALTAYLSAAHRVAFGEEAVVGYLYARELELTAIRTIFAGRAAGLDGDTIRARLRDTYV